MITSTCPPCTHNCDQGRTCPLRKRRTWREVVETARAFIAKLENRHDR